MTMDAISVVKTGANITVGAASASVAMPTDSAGTIPKYIRVASTSACYVKIGQSGVAAAAGDLLINPGGGEVLKVHNQGFIAAIQVSAGGVLQISPLEDR